MIRAQPGDAAAGALELSPGQWLRVPEGIEAVLEDIKKRKKTGK